MSKNTIVTADKIRSMSEAEWNEFRNNSWLRKREYYSKPMPETYLKDKEQFANWVERQNKRRTR